MAHILPSTSQYINHEQNSSQSSRNFGLSFQVVDPGKILLEGTLFCNPERILEKTVRSVPKDEMLTQPRAVFRVEPEKPVFQQAVQDIDYGIPMEEADVATIQAALQNILDLFIPALKKTSGDGQPFLSCFKNKANFPIVIGESGLS
jgi:hypothetical protein